MGDKPLSEPMLTQFTDAYAALGGDELNIFGTAKSSMFEITVAQSPGN